MDRDTSSNARFGTSISPALQPSSSAEGSSTNEKQAISSFNGQYDNRDDIDDVEKQRSNRLDPVAISDRSDEDDDRTAANSAQDEHARRMTGALGEKKLISPSDDGHSHHHHHHHPADSAPTSAEAKENDFPEGGVEAWACVFGTAMVMAFSFGVVNSFGVLQDYYSTSFLQGYSQSDIAWIGALQYFFIFFTGLFAGRAFDLGLFKPLMAFAILLAAFSQMMISLCSQYYQLILAQGIGLGIAVGLLFNLAVSVPTHWFKRRRASALGISATGSSIGGVIFPILLERLIPQIGFPWTMRLIGFGYLILVGGSWFLMKTRIPPAQDIRNGGWRKVQWVQLSAFKNPAYTMFVAGTSLTLFGLYTPFVYMDTFTGYYNIPASGYWLSVLNAASTFGRVIPGFMGDKLGRINTLIPHLVLAVVFLFAFPAFTNLSLIAFTLVYGYCSGCYVSIIAPCVAQLGSTNTVGTRLGMMFGIMSVGGLLGTPISGFILGADPPYRWWPTMAYSGGCVTVGLICCVIARQIAVDNEIRAKI